MGQEATVILLKLKTSKIVFMDPTQYDQGFERQPQKL
jgi:hypothetical protein